MAPFYGWGSTASRLEPLRGGNLLFTTNTSKEQILEKFISLNIPVTENVKIITWIRKESYFVQYFMVRETELLCTGFLFCLKYIS